MSSHRSYGRLEIPALMRIFPPAVTVVLILLVGGLILSLAVPEWMLQHLALNPLGVWQHPWQGITYPFVESSPLNAVFNVLVLGFAGSAIERQWRAGSWVALWLVVSLVCGGLWVLIGGITGQNAVGMGASSCSYGLLGVYGLLYRRTRVLALAGTIEAQHMVMMMIGLGILLNVTQPLNLIWIAGAPVGYLYTRWRWRRVQRQGASVGSPPSRPRGFVDID